MLFCRASRHDLSYLQRFTLGIALVAASASIVTGCDRSPTVEAAAKMPAASAAATTAPAPPPPTPKSAPAPTPPTPPTSPSREAKITNAITLAIAKPAPAGYAAIPAGTTLLGVEIVGSKIRLNFNKALLLNGTGHKLEDAVKQLTNPISDIVADMANVEYQLLIEGKPLAEFL